MHKHSIKSKHGSRLIKHDIEKLKAILAVTARDMGGEAKHALSDSYQNVKNKTENLQANVAEYVSAKPYKALALASFFGLSLWVSHAQKKTCTNSTIV